MNKTASNDQLRKLVHAICVGGASTLSLTALSVPCTAAAAAAVDTASDSDQLTEIVVTGLRASLQKSLDIKRDADGIVDAISAEDIGKFPDSNLATAMERIPGVTVSRQAVSLTGTGGTSSGGGSTQITVRGFGPQFNETLFDGREVPTAIGNASRGFDFGSVGSDFVGQVDVSEDPRRLPLERRDRRDHQYQVSEALRSPRNAIGGLAVGRRCDRPEPGQAERRPVVQRHLRGRSLRHFGGWRPIADSEVRGNHVNIQGWEGGNPASGSGLATCQLPGAAPCAYRPAATPPTGVPASAAATPSIKDWFIQDYGIYQEHTEDKRVGGRFVLQAKPVDGLEMTLDDNYSKETLVQDSVRLQCLVQRQRHHGRDSGARRHSHEFHAAGHAHGLSGADQPVGDHDQHLGSQREVGCERPYLVHVRRLSGRRQAQSRRPDQLWTRTSATATAPTPPRSASSSPAATTCPIRRAMGRPAMLRTSSTPPTSVRTCWWSLTTRIRTPSTS